MDTEVATGIVVVEAVWPYYWRVRRLRYGLQDGEEYRPPTRGALATSRFARWSPAELAILLWHDDVRGRLVSSFTGLPFTSVRAVIFEMREAFRFRRSSQKFNRKRMMLGLEPLRLG